MIDGLNAEQQCVRFKVYYNNKKVPSEFVNLSLYI